MIPTLRNALRIACACLATALLLVPTVAAGGTISVVRDESSDDCESPDDVVHVGSAATVTVWADECQGARIDSRLLPCDDQARGDLGNLEYEYCTPNPHH